jgi:hypothetical protein
MEGCVLVHNFGPSTSIIFIEKPGLQAGPILDINTKSFLDQGCRSGRCQCHPVELQSNSEKKISDLHINQAFLTVSSSQYCPLTKRDADQKAVPSDKKTTC